jgi:Lar family restriction alleviation protein
MAENPSTTNPVLKPCPFCGGDAARVRGFEGAFIECPQCGTESGGYDTDDAAIAAWNRRAGEADLVGALGGLVHLVSEAAELLHDNGYRETANVLRAAVAEGRIAIAKAEGR